MNEQLAKWLTSNNAHCAYAEQIGGRSAKINREIACYILRGGIRIVVERWHAKGREPSWEVFVPATGSIEVAKTIEALDKLVNPPSPALAYGMAFHAGAEAATKLHEDFEKLVQEERAQYAQPEAQGTELIAETVFDLARGFARGRGFSSEDSTEFAHEAAKYFDRNWNRTLQSVKKRR